MSLTKLSHSTGCNCFKVSQQGDTRVLIFLSNDVAKTEQDLLGVMRYQNYEGSMASTGRGSGTAVARDNVQKEIQSSASPPAGEEFPLNPVPSWLVRNGGAWRVRRLSATFT